MSHCLFCQQPLGNQVNWQTFLLLEKTNKRTCVQCAQKLQFITGKICKVCGRPLANIATDFHTQELCHDCKRWEEHPGMRGILKQNRSIYVYNDFLKDIFARFKFRGDHELVFAFQTAFQTTFTQLYHAEPYTIVPIPLSKERLYERGFNQSEALASLLHQPISHFLERPHFEKQSKKSRQERIHSENIFTLKKGSNVKGRTILLIDDIYTTGTTIRHAAAVLREAGAKSVSALTLIRG